MKNTTNTIVALFILVIGSAQTYGMNQERFLADALAYGVKSNSLVLTQHFSLTIFHGAGCDGVFAETLLEKFLISCLGDKTDILAAGLFGIGKPVFSC